MRKVILILLSLCLVFGLSARPKEINQEMLPKQDPYGFEIHQTGKVWSVQSNFGAFGDANSIYPSYDYPGAEGYYYQWEGRLWLGTIIEGEAVVSHCDYGNYEFEPDEPSWGKVGLGVSQWDIVSRYHDWGAKNEGRALGLHVDQRAFQWGVPPYDNFFLYIFDISLHPDKADYPVDNGIDSLFVAFVWDSDVCEADDSDPNIDDMVAFDGWTNGEWADLPNLPEPSDNYTIVEDSVMEGPDGYPDQYTVWGDGPDEATVVSDAQYLIPRNMSYIYDDDHPDEPGNDKGEFGMCEGYIWGRYIYGPTTPVDSVFTDANGNEARIPRAYAHAWWNWENDPGTDKNKLDYMMGIHPMNAGFRYMPIPYDLGAGVFDYRYLLSAGPFSIEPYDTIQIVYASGVGFGLNGYAVDGKETYYGLGRQTGARTAADLALSTYYRGSENSDPAHPSSFEEDVHCLLFAPPPSPQLYYSVEQSGEKRIVHLSWNDVAESTPDPAFGVVDFAGYRVYRTTFAASNWEMIAEFDTDSLEEMPHSYDDTLTEELYKPYFYCVTAYDKGLFGIDPLESSKTNYMKDINGAPKALYLQTDIVTSTLDSVRVVPNPYYGSSIAEDEYEDRIRFVSLPGNWRIKIFTLSGDLVQTIEPDGEHRGEISWNLRSVSDIDICSGLYIYKIEQYDENGEFVDSKLGKFVILR